MNLTPEQREAGRENFRGQMSRRGFMAATVPPPAWWRVVV